MGICPNAYYNYLKNKKAACHAVKVEICDEIKSIYHEFGGILGHRSMRIFLLRKGIILSKTTVFKYMNKELRLLCICRRRRPGYKKGQAHKIFPNLLNQHFEVSEKNKVWCTDFTYLFLSNGALRYNCTIIDLYDRSIIASLNGKEITSQLAIKTLQKALKHHKPDKGLILHSDQGSQFTSREFTEFCEANHVQQSMSQAGCPYDNAPMERFYNTLKNEYFNLRKFRDVESLDHGIYQFIYGKYNRKRPHSYNGGLTPLAARRAA